MTLLLNAICEALKDNGFRPAPPGLEYWMYEYTYLIYRKTRIFVRIDTDEDCIRIDCCPHQTEFNIPIEHPQLIAEIIAAIASVQNMIKSRIYEQS